MPANTVVVTPITQTVTAVNENQTIELTNQTAAVTTAAPTVTTVVSAGQVGPQGAPGVGDKTEIFTQNSASSSWSIPHSLGKFPSVSVVSSTGDQIVPDVHYDSTSLLTLNFGAAYSGKAYLN